MEAVDDSLLEQALGFNFTNSELAYLFSNGYLTCFQEDTNLLPLFYVLETEGYIWHAGYESGPPYTTKLFHITPKYAEFLRARRVMQEI